MQQIKIDNKQVNYHSKEFEEKFAVAALKRLSAEEEDTLINEIHNGLNDSIELLINSWEPIILSVIRQYLNDTVSAELLLTAGKDALRKLAESELNAKPGGKFFRFGVWTVRQAILDRIKERHRLT